MDAKARVGAINKLLSSGKLELKTQVHILHIKKYNLMIVVHPKPVHILVTIPLQGTVIIYMVKDKGTKASTKGMGQEEKIVYKIIEESGG